MSAKVSRKCQRLTKRLLDSAKVPEGKKYIWLWDDKLKGFGARVFASGSITYVIDYYNRQGQQKRMSIGRGNRITMTKVRDIAAEELVKAYTWKDPQSEKDRIRLSPTLKEIADEYLEDRSVDVKGHKEEARILRSADLQELMKRRVMSVDRAEVMKIIRLIKSRAPVSANRTLSVLKRLMQYALNIGYVDINPLLGVKPLSKEQSRRRHLTEDEIRIFWAALDELPGVSLYVESALRLILVTGQRPGEVLGAEWKEVDLEEAVWTVPAEKSKNGIPNRVPLSPLSLEIFRELEQQPARGKNVKSSFVFPAFAGQGIDPKKHMLTSTLSHAIRRNREAIGLEDFTPHDLRRTCATHLERIGFALIVPRVLNHKKLGISGTYQLYTFDREKREALEAWSAELERLIRGEKSKVVSLQQAAQ